MADSPEKKWQDHPVIIAIISGAATLVFAYNVLFPTLTASLQNEVSSLRSQVQEVAGLKAKIATMESAAKQDKDKLVQAQLTNLFTLGNPYPIGLGKIKIGDNMDLVASTYPETAIERKGSFWSVKAEHASFYRIVYYFDRNAKEKKVTQLL